MGAGRHPGHRRVRDSGYTQPVRARAGPGLLPAPDPDHFAAQLMLLFDGAIARAYVTGEAGAAADGKAAAAVLLDAALARSA